MIPYVDKTKKEFEDVDLQYNKDKVKHVRWQDRVLLNRPLQVCLAMVLVAVLTPLLLYQYIFFVGYDLHSPDGYSLGSCLVPRTSRLLCGIGNVSVSECHPQCCYDHSSHLCFHRFPSRFSYILDQNWAENISLRPRIATVPYNSQSSLTNIRLSINEVSPTHLTITYYNSVNLTITGNEIESKNYTYNIASPELNINVNSTQGDIFNTLRGPLIASDNIWEVAIKITEESMYGFGEIPIKEGTVKVIYNHDGGLSSIPLIYAKINDSYHGLLIDTVDPTEVSFRPSNTIVIRSITQSGLKFHLFVGPKPTDVMRDVIKHVNFKNELEYWMLGAHFCSESNNLTNSELSQFIRDANSQNIPFESHCIKPIVFDNQCETESSAHITEGVRLLRNAGKKFLPHVSPHIIFVPNITTEIESENSTETNITLSRTNAECSYGIEHYEDYVLRNPNSSEAYKGLVSGHDVLYPNYDNSSAEIMKALWPHTTDFQGVVLLNSWPLDESEKLVNETHLYLPYFSENFERVFNHTPRWNATCFNDEIYIYRHNKYGNHFARAFEHLKVSPTWSSSQWMNGNVSVHRQNVETSWSSLQNELINAALGGISGHWLWSTPICGDTVNYKIDNNANLCIQWYKTATFLPITRIHSNDSPRDPLSFTGTQRNLIVNALRDRLTLAPYIYTTLQSGPLLRPMFYQFPESDSLNDLTSQFSVGNDLLIVPNLLPRQSMIHIVMPPGIWYEFRSGFQIKSKEGETFTMATTEADTLSLIRGGSIIALQKDVRQTAETTRSISGIALTIALQCVRLNDTRTLSANETLCEASGFLYMASNTTLNFTANADKLAITGEGDYDVFCNMRNRIWNNMITEVTVYGLNSTLNNYDHARVMNTRLNLCDLNSETEIMLVYVST